MARPVGINAQRRADIEAAIKTYKPKDMITLDDMAVIWGVTKQRFANVKREMMTAGVDWPSPQPGPRNSHLYPAKKCCQIMLNFEKRKDKIAEKKSDTIQKILGQKPQDTADIIPISEMAILNREAARAEERAREQGEVCLLSDQAAVAGTVFSYISNLFSDLPALLDPNGELPADLRIKVQDLGNRASARVHAEMKEILSNVPRKRDKKRR